MRKNVRAQAWGTDLIVASMIFFAGIIFFYLFLLNDFSRGAESSIELKRDAEVFSGSVFSSGSPENWTVDSVMRIGILSVEVVNETKLENFYTLTQNDYAETKSLFRITNDYYLNFSEPINLGGNNVNGIGLVPDGASNLFKLSRLAVYDGEIRNFDVFIWN